MIDHALNSHNEHLKLSGDKVTSATYLPFARRTVNTLFNLSKSMDGTPLNKVFKIQNTTIHIKVFGDHKYIDIYTVPLESEKCGKYVSGLVRNCQQAGTTPLLNEYFPKGGSSWQNLQNHAVPCDSFLTDLGYSTASKTQQAYIKSSQYTGFMRYAIQNLLGQNEQIGFKYGFKETDGLILEDVRPKTVSDENGSYSLQDEIDLRYIKISENGVFIKNATHCLPSNITLDFNNPGLIDGSTVVLGIDSEASLERFQSLLKLNSFDIPEEFESYVQTSGTTMLIDADSMAQFYDERTPLFNSCGWVIPSHHTFQEEVEESNGVCRTRIYGIFNTCQDLTKSYLYGIKLIQKRIILSDSFKLTEEYLTNDKYRGNPNVVYEYTATLHKLLEGEMSSPVLSHPWMENETGLYIPNENLDCVVKFNGITEVNIINELSPMYVYDDGSNWGTNEFYLAGVSLLNIHSNIHEQTDPLIKSIEESICNFFGQRYFTNTQLGRYKIVIDNTDFYCSSYMDMDGNSLLVNIDKNSSFDNSSDLFDELLGTAKRITFDSEFMYDRIEDSLRKIDGKIDFINLRHSNEKFIIPMFNRNAVISVYNGYIEDDKNETNYMQFIYRYVDGQPLIVETSFSKLVDGYTEFQNAEFTLVDGIWVNSNAFNMLDYIAPYLLFYYKNNARHYIIPDLSPYIMGKYPQLNKGADYDDINWVYNIEAKDWVADYIEWYMMGGDIFRLELVFDIFSTNWVFNLLFEEGPAYVSSIADYPSIDNFSYINFIGRP